MVWDDENAVGLMTKHFSCIRLFALSNFVTSFIGDLDVSHFGPNPGRVAPLGGDTTLRDRI